MIAKEWRDARWKFAVATVLVVLLSSYLTPYEELVRMAESQFDPEQMALDEMWGFYNVGGLVILGSLALLLGGTLVAGETGGGTILLLLSRPISRSKVLLTKYAVCAATLLVSAVLGGVLLVCVATLRGYPLENVSLTGILLLGLMMWLVSLFVLGVALLMSVLFRSLISSLGITALILLLFFTFPENILNVISFFDYRLVSYNQQWYEFSSKLAPGRYLIAPGVFEGKALGATKFLYWAIAAAVPLLAALWVFRRRSY